METRFEDSGFGCCSCPDVSEDFPWSSGCEGKKDVFTKREQDVLEKIREASLQARALREKIRDLAADPAGRALREDAEHELERLRVLREELERERIAAAEERMRLLGHL